MQDPEIPPEVEGEEDGGAVGVRKIIAVAADKAVTGKIQAAVSIARPWITAIVLCWGMETGTNQPVAPGPVLLPAISNPILNRFQRGKMRRPESLLSSTICSSWPKSRKRRAR